MSEILYYCLQLPAAILSLAILTLRRFLMRFYGACKDACTRAIWLRGMQKDTHNPIRLDFGMRKVAYPSDGQFHRT